MRNDAMKPVSNAFVAMCLGVGSVCAQSYCDLVVQACPKNFPGVVTVPKNTTAISAIMPTCDERIEINRPAVVPPSIVFIIDNSGSMSMAGGGTSNETDPNEARFTETIRMLDDVFARAPKATVGIVSFSRRLQYDIRDPHHLAPAFPNDPTQFEAYIPLTRLDTVFANGVTGIDTLKALLKHGPDGDLVHDARNHPEPRPSDADDNDMRYGTDITLGFDAAKVAMANSTAAKANQYFIFLSDGEPSGTDFLSPERNAARLQFRSGINTPTTFTVFFSTNSGGSSTLINQMTDSIKINGYSTSNPLSAVWNISNPSTNLRTILESQILGSIIVAAPASSQSAVLTSGGITQTSTGFQNNAFLFNRRIPLQEDVTQVGFTVNYRYVDSVTNQPKDTAFTYNLTVQRTGAPVPAGATTQCREAPQIALIANGTPITVVTADHPNVTTQVTLGAGQTCTGCTSKLSSTRSTDQETIALVGPANVVSGNFRRDASSTVIPGDAILQHLAIGDSIVVVFTNPEYPLETSRRAFKFENTQTVLQPNWQNRIARTIEIDPNMPGASADKQFLLVGAPTLKVDPVDGSTNCCVVKGGWNPTNVQDTSNYTGIKLSATREFSAQLRIYDNLGMIINQTAFKVSKAEFAKLPQDPLTKARTVELLWNGRTKEGRRVGTGAYIVRGTITLETEAGIAEDKRVARFSERIGVIRKL